MDLLQEQSDLNLHYLLRSLLNHFRRRQKKTCFVVIGALRVKISWYEPSSSYIIYMYLR